MLIFDDEGDRPVAVLVSSSTALRSTLQSHLEVEGFVVGLCGDAYLGLETLRENRVDVLVTEHELPGMTGTELIARVREFSEIPIVAISAKATIQLCDSTHRAGAQHFADAAHSVESVASTAWKLAVSREDEDDFMTVERARSRRVSDEKRWYSSLVAAFDGNISAIARHLDVDRSTVQYHLTRLGLR